ncbi:MAG: tetratricopeptide repeat protein [Pseudohongiellaceae bacterium]|jgi:tetratricopeptide (TPR) repeat protein
MFRVMLCAGIGPALGLVAMSAGAETMFLDGGYAELCAAAAYAAKDPNAKQRFEITGSRLGLPPMEICDRAVNGYDGASENVAESYNNRGVLWFMQTDLAAALEDFRRAIREQGSLAQAHVNLGYTLNALQRWDEAIAALTRGIELGTDEAARALFSRAIAHEERGQLRAAYDDYRRASELEPEWEPPRVELQRFRINQR